MYLRNIGIESTLIWPVVAVDKVKHSEKIVFFNYIYQFLFVQGLILISLSHVFSTENHLVISSNEKFLKNAV